MGQTVSKVVSRSATTEPGELSVVLALDRLRQTSSAHSSIDSLDTPTMSLDPFVMDNSARGKALYLSTILPVKWVMLVSVIVRWWH